MARAPVKSSFLISFLKRGEPVTFERSPTFTNGVLPMMILKASRPLKRCAGTAVGIVRGAYWLTCWMIAAM